MPCHRGRQGRPCWCWTRPPSTPKWAVRWPTTALITADGSLFACSDVQKTKGGKYVHYGCVLESGIVAVGDR